MKPIENWRDSWRFAVQWVQGLGASAMAAWLLLTDEQRASLLGLLGATPDQAVAFTALAFFLTGMAARVVKQDSA
jgi:hypothetical protein